MVRDYLYPSIELYITVSEIILHKSKSVNSKVCREEQGLETLKKSVNNKSANNGSANNKDFLYISHMMNIEKLNKI